MKLTKRIILSGYLTLFSVLFSFSQTAITSQVNAGSDDAEESISDRGVDLTSSDLELINQ